MLRVWYLFSGMQRNWFQSPSTSITLETRRGSTHWIYSPSTGVQVPVKEIFQNQYHLVVGHGIHNKENDFEKKHIGTKTRRSGTESIEHKDNHKFRKQTIAGGIKTNVTADRGSDQVIMSCEYRMPCGYLHGTTCCQNP